MRLAGFVLDITWDAPHLPSIVGPFASREEAEDWAALNIPNGSWCICPVADPYARPK